MWLLAISTNHRHDKHAHMIYTYICMLYIYIDVTICSPHRKADKTINFAWRLIPVDATSNHHIYPIYHMDSNIDHEIY